QDLLLKAERILPIVRPVEPGIESLIHPAPEPGARPELRQFREAVPVAVGPRSAVEAQKHRVDRMRQPDALALHIFSGSDFDRTLAVTEYIVGKTESWYGVRPIRHVVDSRKIAGGYETASGRLLRFDRCVEVFEPDAGIDRGASNRPRVLHV